MTKLNPHEPASMLENSIVGTVNMDYKNSYGKWMVLKSNLIGFISDLFTLRILP